MEDFILLTVDYFLLQLFIGWRTVSNLDAIPASDALIL